jgi:hypothetical protein
MSLLIIFNEQFFEFVADIQLTFPDDCDLQTAINYLKMIRKANPKTIVKIWQNNIVMKYDEQIKKGDLNYFLEKDYSADVQSTEYSKKIVENINRFKKPIKEMSVENQTKSMKYIQNLTYLSKEIFAMKIVQ